MSLENFSERYPDALPEMENNLGDPESLKPAVDLEQIKEDVRGSEGLERLTNEALDYCERYTETVAQFHEALIKTTKENEDELEVADKTRRIVHSAAEDSIKILARELTKSGRNADWIKGFKSRADYGKFAMVTTYRILERQKEENERKERQS